MPDLDEFLKNELRRTVRPVDVNDVSSRIDLRRTRRARLRKIQAVALTVVVLAGTAGGVVMLSNVFRTRGAEIGSSANVGNGVIVYSEVRNAGQQLWSVHPDGTGARQLTTGDGFSDTSPSVSPDGRTIAFTRTDEHGSVIFTIGIEGDGLTRLAGALATDPAWSPDGTQLAFAGSPRGPYGIYVIGADGANPRLVPGTDELSVAHPAWSPDGTSIVFEATAGAPEAGATWDIYSAPVEGSGLKDLSQTPNASEITPAWSPDGSRLAFARNGSLWLRDIATGNESPLTSSIGRQLDANPSWSPDGLSIVFDRTLATGTFLMTMGADGSGITLVARNAIDAAWQPIAPELLTPAASTPTPAGGSVDLGLGFSVCDVQSMSADFDGNGSPDVAYLATKISGVGSCPSPSDHAYLGIDTNGDGQVDRAIGPLSCDASCRPFGTPDLDGDGRADIAIVQQDHPVDFVTTYSLVDPGSDHAGLGAFAGSDTTGTHAFPIAWGALPDGVAGAYCGSQEEGTYRLVTWSATNNPDGTYALTQRLWVVTGETFQFVSESNDPSVPKDTLPEGGGSTFCGVPVTP